MYLGNIPPNGLDLLSHLPALLLSAVDPDIVSTPGVSYPTPVFIFSVGLDYNKPLSLLSKQKNCHSKVTTNKSAKGRDMFK